MERTNFSFPINSLYLHCLYKQRSLLKADSFFRSVKIQVTFIVSTHLTLDCKSHKYVYGIVIAIGNTHQEFRSQNSVPQRLLFLWIY